MQLGMQTVVIRCQTGMHAADRSQHTLAELADRKQTYMRAWVYQSRLADRHAGVMHAIKSELENKVGR
jgi:hypothetical protein